MRRAHLLASLLAVLTPVSLQGNIKSEWKEKSFIEPTETNAPAVRPGPDPSWNGEYEKSSSQTPEPTKATVKIESVTREEIVSIAVAVVFALIGLFLMLYVARKCLQDYLAKRREMALLAAEKDPDPIPGHPIAHTTLQVLRNRIDKDYPKTNGPKILLRNPIYLPTAPSPLAVVNKTSPSGEISSLKPKAAPLTAGPPKAAPLTAGPPKAATLTAAPPKDANRQIERLQREDDSTVNTAAGTGNIPAGTGNIPAGTGNIPAGTGNIPRVDSFRVSEITKL